jgi:hypothetical protein
MLELLEKPWHHQLAERSEAGFRWWGPEYEPAMLSGYVFTAPTTGAPIQVRAIDQYFA